VEGRREARAGKEEEEKRNGGEEGGKEGQEKRGSRKKSRFASEEAVAPAAAAGGEGGKKGRMEGGMEGGMDVKRTSRCEARSGDGHCVSLRFEWNGVRCGVVHAKISPALPPLLVCRSCSLDAAAIVMAKAQELSLRIKANQAGGAPATLPPSVPPSLPPSLSTPAQPSVLPSPPAAGSGAPAIQQAAALQEQVRMGKEEGGRKGVKGEGKRYDVQST
jgi:hypothetical protein